MSLLVCSDFSVSLCSCIHHCITSCKQTRMLWHKISARIAHNLFFMSHKLLWSKGTSKHWRTSWGWVGHEILFCLQQGSLKLVLQTNLYATASCWHLDLPDHTDYPLAWASKENQICFSPVSENSNSAKKKQKILHLHSSADQIRFSLSVERVSKQKHNNRFFMGDQLKVQVCKIPWHL